MSAEAAPYRQRNARVPAFAGTPGLIARHGPQGMPVPWMRPSSSQGIKTLGALSGLKPCPPPASTPATSPYQNPRRPVGIKTPGIGRAIAEHRPALIGCLKMRRSGKSRRPYGGGWLPQRSCRNNGAGATAAGKVVELGRRNRYAAVTARRLLSGKWRSGSRHAAVGCLAITSHCGRVSF